MLFDISQKLWVILRREKDSDSGKNEITLKSAQNC